jgi:hypothetical protein
MVMRLQLSQYSKRAFTLLLGVALGLAIFISPYTLHHSPGSIFFTEISSSAESPSHEHHQETKEIRCLRCVLYGFQLPETIAPLLVIFIVLGFLKLAKPPEPFSFIPLSKSARAPPAII